jgi:hypothetical protein
MCSPCNARRVGSCSIIPVRDAGALSKLALRMKWRECAKFAGRGGRRWDLKMLI